MELTEELRFADTQATVAYVFAADCLRTAAPFSRAIAEELGKHFQVLEISYQPGDRPSWTANKGEALLADDRKVAIKSILGTDLELSVTVQGSSADARDVLDEVWSRLGELAEEAEAPITDQPGSFGYVTAATVVVPRSFFELFSGLGRARAFIDESLDHVEPADGRWFSVTLPIRVKVHGVTVERQVRLEPRFTSKRDDRVLYTVSPFDSDGHRRLLRELCSPA